MRSCQYFIWKSRQHHSFFEWLPKNFSERNSNREFFHPPKTMQLSEFVLRFRWEVFVGGFLEVWMRTIWTPWTSSKKVRPPWSWQFWSDPSSDRRVVPKKKRDRLNGPGWVAGRVWRRHNQAGTSRVGGRNDGRFLMLAYTFGHNPPFFFRGYQVRIGDL